MESEDVDYESVKKMAEEFANSAKSQELAADMRKIILVNGLAGGTALLKAIILNCPQMKNRLELCKQIKYPDNLQPSPDGKFGGIKLEFAPGGQKPRSFMLHVGQVTAQHDLGAELAKLNGLASEEDLVTIRDQMAQLMYYARRAYSYMLLENQDVLNKMKANMAALPAFDPVAIHVDDANSTMYLAESPAEDAKKWEPRCGLLISSI